MPIASGLQPEMNATLKLYNWEDYIYTKVLRDFEKKFKQYNVKVQLSTFNNSDEALAKIRSGQVDFDIFVPDPGPAGQADRLEIHPAAQPFATSRTSRTCGRSSRTPSTTRVGSTRSPTSSTRPASHGAPTRSPRTSRPWPNPYDIFWDPQYKGKTEVLDDYRETIEHGAAPQPHLRRQHGGSRRTSTWSKTQLLQLMQAVNSHREHLRLRRPPRGPRPGSTRRGPAT